MKKLDKNLLDKSFPSVKAGNTGRYDRDDILKVLEFMRDNPSVQIKSIEEYSNISLGTLVSWRKKYGKTLGIRIKNYDGSPEDTSIRAPIDEKHIENQQIGNYELKIPLSLIQELRKINDSGAVAEVAFGQKAVRVDDQYIYIYEKS